MLLDKEKANSLLNKNINELDIIIGIRPEHMLLSSTTNPNAIKCNILVNEMMGSELHLHVINESNEKFIIRVPTISLSNETRSNLMQGNTIYVCFESKAIHLFDANTLESLLV